jgi:eukaryotic-like serine/threonine-protein kinase
MNAAFHDRVEELFHAVHMAAPGQSGRLLEEACGDDEALRAEVESLLGVAADPPSFLDRPLVDDASLSLATIDPDAAESPPPCTIASYRLVQEIGRGGMGRVYEAEHMDTGRRVAVKLLRPTMASSVFLRRFRAEQRILARLHHAGIARQYAAGTTDQGLPYLVMEYVGGQTLRSFCSEQRLGLTGRLDLFARVCDAVQYAHEQRVVHRDLKPSNILVTSSGDPKLLDFGIAKLLHEDVDPTDLHPTVTGLRLMTREYASPEQIRGEPVTTASDVYSLGVVLYELLSERRPYRPAGNSPHDLERCVLEHIPDKPSKAVLRPADEPARAPLTPRSAKQHARALRGDLDNIVSKALSKNPVLRYGSAGELADDVRRYLGGLPVRARGERFGCRVRTFVSRHRFALVAAVAVAASLLLALVLTMNAVAAVQHGALAGVSTSPLTELAVQPHARKRPVTLDGRGGEAQEVRRFVD